MNTASPAAAAAEEGVTLNMSRRFNASQERVYRAFAEGDLVAQWFGPDGFDCTVHEYDARPGGGYSVIMCSPEGTQHPLSGTFHEVTPFDRLVFTWIWGGEGDLAGRETLVELDFVPVGDQTELRLTHTMLPSEEACNQHRGGWDSSFVCLSRLLK